MPNYTPKTKATKNNITGQQKKNKSTTVKKDELATTAPSKQTESQKNKLPKKLVGIIAAKAAKSSAAKQRGKANLMKQKAKVQASKNKTASTPKPKKKKVDSAATKKGEVKPTSNMSKANLFLNKPEGVFGNINADSKHEFKMIKTGPQPEMAAQMKDYHPAKMSDTDMGIEYRFGKQATADVKAAQQQGIPNLYKDVERIKEGTEPSKSHTSGMPETIEHVDTGDKFNTTTGNIDEGNFSNFHTKVPERTKVTAEEDGMNYQSGDEFYADGAASKMKMKMHPAQQRMSNMVNKVAQYKMPNVKAAQKKYNK